MPGITNFSGARQFKMTGILAGMIMVALMVSSFGLLRANGEEKPLVYVMKVENTVTSGTARYIQRGLQLAERNQAEACIIRLNTPGGLVAATLDIIQAMSAAEVPIITYVNPEGGIAASAGTFILLNGHIAAMSPGTTCGAAMPVTVSPTAEGRKAADQKTINFLAGHMKSIARQRDRPSDLAGKFVTDNLVLSNREALEAGVVDFNAASIEELLNTVHGAQIKVNREARVLNTAGARTMPIPVSTSEKMISLISDPTLAMILLMIGIYGLIIGFFSPGFMLPEVLGSISLVLGLSGMGLFQGNLTAGLLILLGIGLLIAELLTPTFGILGIGGVVSLVMGIILFPVEPLMPQGWFSAFRYAAVGVGAVGTAFLLIALAGIAKLRKRRPVHGEAEFAGTIATVSSDLDPSGFVRLHGEVWQAISKTGHAIAKGDLVRVIERQGMLLVVEPINKDEE